MKRSNTFQHRRRWRELRVITTSHPGGGRLRAPLVLAAAVVSAVAFLAASLGEASAAPGAGPGAAPTIWPSHPDWQRYVQAPASRDVHPVAVVSTSGQVTGAEALTHPGRGQSATLTRTAADT